MTLETGRRLSTQERRTEMVEIGIRLFAERGLWDLSTEELASAAGVSKALLFHHFGTKRGYFLAVVREIATRLEMATLMDPRVPLEINLRLLVDSFVTLVRDNPAVYQLLRGAYEGDPEVREIANATRLLEVERILEVLALRNPSLPFRTALHGWVGFVEATTLSWVEHQGFPEEELVELSVRAIAPLLEMAAEEVS